MAPIYWIAVIALGWLVHELHQTRLELSESTLRLGRLESQLKAQPESANPTTPPQPQMVASSPVNAQTGDQTSGLQKQIDSIELELKSKRSELEGAQQEINSARNRGEVPIPASSGTGLENELAQAKVQEKSLEATLKIAQAETKSFGSTERILNEQTQMLESRDEAQFNSDIQVKNAELSDARAKLNRDKALLRQFPSLSGQVYFEGNSVRTLQNQLSELRVRRSAVISQWKASRNESHQKTRAEVDAAKKSEQDIRERILEQKNYIQDLETRIAQIKKTRDGGAKFYEAQQKRVSDLEKSIANLESRRTDLLRQMNPNSKSR